MYLLRSVFMIYKLNYVEHELYISAMALVSREKT